MLLQVFLQLSHVQVVLVEPAIVVAVLAAIAFTLEIIIAGRAILVSGGLAAMADYLVHPPLFRLRGRIDRLKVMLADVLDTFRDVLPLGL